MPVHIEDFETVMRDRDRWHERAETNAAKVRRVERLHVWTNEDGKRFVFADDLAEALGLPF